MIFEYLQHGFHDHRAETFFKGVYHVPAATWIELPLGDAAPRRPARSPAAAREHRLLDAGADHATAATTRPTSGAASARASSGASSPRSRSAPASPAASTPRPSSAS